MNTEDLIKSAAQHEELCNDEFNNKEEVSKSQLEFDWRVVEPNDGSKWMSWEMLGYDGMDERHTVEWTYCAQLSHSFTGIVKLKPGQHQPLHTHTTPEIYYILKVKFLP